MRIHNPQVVKAAGITLLEVLISVLLLCVGIFGALKLQITALIAARHAAYTSNALDLANELATNMCSNPEQMRVDGSSPFLRIDYRADRDSINPGTSCFANACRPDQLAAADIANWLHNLTRQLPNARALVCQDHRSWDRNKQQLRWECNGDQRESGAATVVIKLGWAENNEAAGPSSPRVALPVLAQTN